VWELDAKDIVERKLEGLYPLLPLMKNEAAASKQEILNNAISAIKSVKDLSLQNEFLAIMSLLAQDKNRFDVDLIRSCINKEELMSSELIQILVKEIYADELKKASENLKTHLMLLSRKVQDDSLSIPDIAKAVRVSESDVRDAKAEWMLQSGKPIPDIVSATGLTVPKIKNIHIEMLLYDGISTEEISRETKVSFRKIHKMQTKLIKDGFLEKPAYSEYKNISQTYLILASSNISVNSAK
jgi:transposase